MGVVHAEITRPAIAMCSAFGIRRDGSFIGIAFLAPNCLNRLDGMKLLCDKMTGR